ncbi:MAG: hypothetical protein QOF74_5821 [Caballeronia mineralivorans]|jgi:hypothetical protein|nr:hypothetical protein [Caballeronia mineralivorans]
MAKSQPRHGIPVQLSDAQFDEFVLPHLTRGHRGPTPKLPLRKIFRLIKISTSLRTVAKSG